MNMDDAVKAGAMALFGEKYGCRGAGVDDGVRFPLSYAGGNPRRPRRRTFGLFKIISEGGIARVCAALRR